MPYCRICGKPLTDYTSIKRGIGPVCSAKECSTMELPLFDHAEFSVIRATNDYIFIKDNGGEKWGISKSITNDAHFVVMQLSMQYNGVCGRIFYIDTTGQIDELLHNGKGRFTGFKAGHEGVEL